MFHLEKTDEIEFSHIDDYLKKGGQIFFAMDEEGNAMATCMIAPHDNGDYEIMKFAARGMYTEKGAGRACLEACIDYAKKKGVKRIVIVSNTKCTHALSLYRKAGFKEIPIDEDEKAFSRVDIEFEMLWD